MSDLNVNGVNSVNNSQNSEVKELKVKKEEPQNSVFGSENKNDVEMVSVKSNKLVTQKGDKVRFNSGILGGNKAQGQIGGFSFEIKAPRGFSREFSGEFANQPIKVKSRIKNPLTSTRYITGTVAGSELEMTNKRDHMLSNDRLYQGTYKGKSFEVTYDYTTLKPDAIKGKYGDENVEVLLKSKFLSFSDDIETKELPADFAPVTALIMAIEKDSEDKREDAARSKSTNTSTF
jgi:hypothetical protein